MNQAFVEINGIYTKVVTWGRWIEDIQGQNNEIIILIPGNPGIPGFYNKFAETLYEKTDIPVWCVGHAGHNFADKSLIRFPKFEHRKDLYDIKGQVEHKIEFFKKYVPNDAKVYLIAHSIGSHMTLEILEHADVKSKIQKAFLLFPAFERTAKTRNGKFLNIFVRPIVSLILFVTWIFTILPTLVATLILYIYMFIANVPPDLHEQNIKDLLKPGVLRRVFFLIFNKMDTVSQRNNEVIANNVDKIKIYYGRTDAWAPEQFYKDIKTDISCVDAELTDINHTFVFRHSVDVACTLAGWIKAVN